MSKMIYGKGQQSTAVRRRCSAGMMIGFYLVLASSLQAQYQMENTDRGLVAIRTSSTQVYVGWKMFGTDPSGTGFNVYRGSTKLNATPITSTTNYVDNTNANGTYSIRPVLNGIEQAASESVGVWSQQYLEVPLQIPPGGTTPSGESYTYQPNDCSVGDLDGDGRYEIVVKWDPSNAKDNSSGGYTGNQILDAYRLDGTRLWRIDLGINIRAGAHYTQFLVYDLDGDGRAEVACKTADGTRDGQGTVIGSATADYRNANGYILEGPEFLTVFEGTTGRALATTNYLVPRGNVSSWGDNYGNRVDRFVAAIAYLDGQRPSLVMGRGYYTRMARTAWDWRNGALTHRWTFDNNTNYSGQGNHQMTIGDSDGDGRHEIFNGSSAINDNGAGFWVNGKGHGDALHMSDMDPDRPGLEIWMPYESPSSSGNLGAALIDAQTGAILWSRPGSTDIGRANAADIDPNHKGYEVWAAGGTGGVFNIHGTQLSSSRPSINFSIWWDGDLQRELLDGTTISKWNPSTGAASTILSPSGVASNNGTKATPALTADLFGDWREEVIWRTSGNNALRIYTTTIPTSTRIYTLMHDPQYRMAVAWQNSGYNQPPHPGFYLGGGMSTPPQPNIVLVGGNTCTPTTITPYIEVNGTASQAAGVTVAAGATVVLSPQPSSGGSWSWSGPNGFSAGTREVTLADIQASQGGSYGVTYTNTCGSTSTATFTVTVSGTGTSVTIQENTTGFCSVDGTVDNNNGGFTGTGFANSDNTAGAGVTWRVTTASGAHTFSWRYANGGGSDRPASVFVDGASVVSGISFPATSDWTTWTTASATVTLSAGTHTVRLEATGNGGLANIDQIVITGSAVQPAACSGDVSLTIQENTAGFCSVDGTVDSNNAGFTGTGFANSDNATGVGVNWRVTTSSGSYTLNWRYSNGGGNDRPAQLLVNGASVVSGISFPATPDWTTWTDVSATVTLGAGTHTIRLQATGSSGLANIDNVTISGPGVETAGCTATASAMTTVDEPAPEMVAVQSGSLRAVPNPVDDNILEVRTYLKTKTSVAISVIDAITGREVYAEALGMREAGELQHRIPATSLVRGTYVVRLRTDAGIDSVKIIRK